MSIPLSKLDHFKLETTFGDGFVINSTIDWEFSTKRTQISTWRRERLLGAGGFGSVWLERKVDGGQLRAVKMIQRNLVVTMGFAQELLALITLADAGAPSRPYCCTVSLLQHRHLFVEFYGWYENQNDIFLAMEYIQYGDLSDYIKDEEKARPHAREITKQILEGLVVLHAEGICHRDLKPQNVLLASRDPLWVKIADFGTSKRSANTALRTMCGTQGYLAPELLRILPRGRWNPESFSHALDMWSLGCMVHQLLTSQTPFLERDVGDSEVESGFTNYEPEVDMGSLYEYCHGRKSFPTEALRSCQVPADGVDFVRRLLAPSPDARPTVVTALREPWLQDTGYTSDFCRVLQGECLDLGFRLQHMNDRSLIRQIRARDVAHYLPASIHKSLSLLLADALRKGHHFIALLLVKSQIRTCGDRDGIQFETIFEQAVREGEVNWMKVLLSGDRDVNTPFRDGRTALQAAIQHGHIGMVQLLVDNGAEVNIEPAFDQIPSKTDFPPTLQVAIKTRRFDPVNLLVKNKADLNSNTNGRSMLHIAAFLGHIGIVKLLLVNMAKVNAGRGSQTALVGAINGAHTQVVKLLLDHKANVTANSTSQIPLGTAIVNGHFDILKLLLDYGADSNTEFSGRTALQLAVENGHTDLVQLLLENKARVNDEVNGRRVLQIAIKCRHSDIVSLLLDRDAHIHATENSQTAFLAAVREGSIDIVKLLLDRNVDVGGTVDGRTAPQTVVQHGHNDMFEIIPDHHLYMQTTDGTRAPFRGAVDGGYIGTVRQCFLYQGDANDKDKYGHTALYMAVQHGDVEMVKLLVAYKADVNSEPSEETGRTVLQLAAERGLIHILKHLLDNGARVDAKPSKENSRTALEAAVEQGYLDIVQMLLDHNAQINAKPERANGRTVLQIAIENGHVDIAMQLLAHGADVNACWGSRTPLQTAVDCGDSSMVQLLLDNNVDINAKASEDNDRTTLQRAVVAGYTDVVKLLLQYGVDVDARASHTGWTALQLAALYGYIDIAELLLKNNADVNIEQSGRGCRALNAAIRNNHIKLVGLLIQNNANVNPTSTNPGSRTPLQTAVLSGHETMVKLLLLRGADVNGELCVNGRTALDEAISGKNLRMMQLLLSHKVSVNVRQAVRVNVQQAYRNGSRAVYQAIDSGFVGILKLLVNTDAITTPHIAGQEQQGEILNLLLAHAEKERWAVLKAEILLLVVVDFLSGTLSHSGGPHTNMPGLPGVHLHEYPLRWLEPYVKSSIKVTLATALLSEIDTYPGNEKYDPLKSFSLAALISATTLLYLPRGVESGHKLFKDGIFTPVVVFGIRFLFGFGRFRHTPWWTVATSPLLVRLITMLPNSKSSMAQFLLELLVHRFFGNVSAPSYVIRGRILQYLIHLVYLVRKATRAGDGSNPDFGNVDVLARRFGLAVFCCLGRVAWSCL